MNLFDLQPEGSKAVVPWLRRDNLLPGTCLPPTVLLLSLLPTGLLAANLFIQICNLLEKIFFKIPEKQSKGEQTILER